LWAQHPETLLVIAPRRPERFDEAESRIVRTGLRYQRRTGIRDRVPLEVRVVLLDSVGELVRLLPAATAVFVGGTVAPIGGHNVLEPARYGKPVAFGPSLDNVADAARSLCEQRGGVLVREPSELARHWQQCLDDADSAAAMGARAAAVASAGNAVIERTWALIAPHLDGR
jgi:3-deoxy-D-manno-octulosonic-acid transferase